MIRNFFIIAWRNLKKNKSFSLINLLGLSVGISACLLIVLYIVDELSYDRFLQDSPRIYQANISGNMGGEEIYAANTPPPLGKTLVSDFPAIETYTRIFKPGDVLIRHNRNGVAENYFTEHNVLAVDSNFFQVFSFDMLFGNARQALQEPHSIVLTEKMALKYFGNSNVVGEMIEYGDQFTPYRIMGVLKNIPRQSSLQFDFLVPMQTYNVVKYFDWSWVWLNVHTYVKLKEAVAGDEKAIENMEAQFPDMVKRHAAKAFARISMPLDEFYKNGRHWDFKLQPYTRVHLYSSGIYNGLMELGSIRNLYIFGIVALFIVLLACVNFMNLATAKSFSRAKEAGVRKVLGSSSGRLTLQFLAESILFSIIATAIALVFVAFILPAFNKFAVKELVFTSIFNHQVWLGIMGLALFCGLLAGSYPAFYLSSFKPVWVLKGGMSRKGDNAWVRNVLVVFQFSVSVTLIICTIIVFNQLQYAQKFNLGLDKENVLIIANAHRLEDKKETFRQEIAGMNGIASASISTNIPTAGAFGDRYIPKAGNQETLLAKEIALYSYMTDEYFLSSMNIKLRAGRGFSKEFADSASVILNETAVRQIGWKNPVGQWLQYPGGNDTRFKVIGVVKDFNMESLKNTVVPFAIFHSSSKTYDEPQSYIVARIKPGNIPAAVAAIESKWKTFVPGMPLDYSFLDARFNQLYQTEEQMGQLFIVFALLSIIVACLGLFGLSAFAAEQRKKEIGIRKVLGASVSGIVGLLSKDFLKLVVFAAILAFPVAWWAMNRWLEDFAYRSPVAWWIFALAAILAALIALFTVSFQAIKAAVANPVKSLRTE